MWILSYLLSIVSSPGVSVTLVLLACTIAAIYLYSKRNFGFWEKRDVTFMKPLPFVGNLREVVFFRRHFGEVLRDAYFWCCQNNARFIGMYFFDQPVLFVKDLTLWKTMLHKDFEYFTDKGFTASKADVLNGEALFGRKGKYWKDLRSKLSPAFTAGKLKKFFALLDQKATCLDTYFNDAAKTGIPLNVADVCNRFAIDSVATIGFGLDSNALVNDEDELLQTLNHIFTYNKTFLILILMAFVDAPALRPLQVSFAPKELLKYLRRAIWGVIGERQRAGTAGVRGDFLDLLMELREKGNIAGDDEPTASESATAGMERKGVVEMDGDILISQAFTFLAAGFDTTATTMSFALYHLAMDKVIQDNLRTELTKSVQNHEGKLTYEAIQNCSYLEMVVSETLRMYPISPFMDRTCTKDYRIPGTDIIIEKGVRTFASVLGLHHDPNIYPDPNSFDPERFSEDNKLLNTSGAFLSFGDGQRMCIGMRLGRLQVKIGLAHIILNFELHPCEKTPKSMEYDLHSFLLQPRHGVVLKFSPVSK